ncbi:uncharacterized protein LOC143106110 [Alosa pseudoharengus]|uniref:uncharacterized protein LOC143106110 n=1 Tax=Alosa pseudoharengus TaxID=34774 RepID=UPI003F8A530C
MTSFGALVLLWGTFHLFGYASEISVWQTPKDLNVMEGADAIITCHFVTDEDSIKKLFISWKKDNETNYYFQQIQSNMSCSLCNSVLQFKSLLQNQSGLYRCNVKMEIPMLQEGHGNGTYVYVTGRSEGPGVVPVNVWILAFCVLFLLIIFVISAMVFRRCKTNRDNQDRQDGVGNDPQVVPQESASQDTDEITYASVNTQKLFFRENQQKRPGSLKSQTQGMNSTEEEPVVYSVIQRKHVD